MTYQELEGLSFEISKGGVNWKPLEYTYDFPILTGGYWEKIIVRPNGELPEDVNYLKIVFDQGKQAWDKHLARISIN